MIDVIIPAYNAHDTIHKTLASIACQSIANLLKVYIINDASNKDYKDEIDFFKNFIDVQEIVLRDNKGPGFARQCGIDFSNSKYIVFIDADDVFSGPIALDVLYRKIEETGSDIIISSFYEELYDGTKEEHKEDKVWLHGKIYRRSFLEKNDIRFNETRANEDNGFNQLVLLNDSNVEYIDDFTYIWLYNEKSITRINNQEYLFGGLDGYIYNMTWALDIAINTNCDYYKIAKLAYEIIVTIYYYYIQFIMEENVDSLIKNSRRLYEIYSKYQLTEEKELEIWQNVYEYMTEDMNIKEKVNPPLSLEEFKDRIKRDCVEKNVIVAMSCTETWYDHLVVGLYSLLKNTERIKKIYLLVETENIEDIPFLDSINNMFDVEFKLVKANKLIQKRFKKDSPNVDSFFTNFACGKLILPEIVEEDKVLYLDTDTLVVNDISNIWDYDMSDYYIAGVKDWGIERRGNIEELGIDGKYVNSGVVLFNLDKMRKDKIEKKCFDLINSTELIFPDQDALNYVCTEKELYLPSMYNVCDDVTLDLENRELAKIYHFAGIKDDWVVNFRYAEEWYNVEEKFNKEIRSTK